MRRVIDAEVPNSKTGVAEEHDLFSYSDDESQVKGAQVCLIYGRNGAGKSTFARDLYSSLESGECNLRMSEGRSATVLADAGGRTVSPSLFNEDFVNAIGFRQEEGEDGRLKSIVLFGEQVENRAEIDDLESRREDLERELTDLSNRCHEIGSRHEGLIKRKNQQLRDQLKSEGSWVESMKQIKPSEKTPRVDEKLIGRLKSCVLASEAEPEQTRMTLDDLVKKRSELLGQLLRVREMNPVNPEVRDCIFSWDLKAAKANFERVPRRDSDSEIEQHYSQLLERPEGAAFLKIIEELVIDGSVSQCPACTQKIEKNLRDQINDAFENLLRSDESKEIVASIDALDEPKFLLPVGLEEAQREAVGEAVATEFENSRLVLEKELSVLSRLREQKMEAPEVSLELPVERISMALSDFETARDKCLKELRDFNETVRGRLRLSEDYQDLTDQIVVRDHSVVEPLKELDALEKELAQNEATAEGLKADINTLADKVTKLRARELDHEAAVSVMNRYLTVVFADPERLVLRPDGQAYRILSHGHDVTLDSLSTGERNIIGLVYFLASIFEETSDYKTYKDQRFLILDDPISSFDSDNRFGVFLLLRQVIEKFIRNPDTQIILISHDIALIQDMAAVLKTINGASSAVRKIESHQIEQLKLDRFSNYVDYLKKIYDFACADDPEAVNRQDVPAGNEMRLVLEAFAEFEVSAGIADLPNRKIVSTLVAEESVALNRYFEGPLYKLLLHGESHSAEAVRSGDYTLNNRTSRRERQGIARDLISLMTIISPAHIPAKLSMKIPGSTEGDPYHQVGFEQRCFAWKAAIEQRTLTPRETR
ncbi:wobble nucleotide-excising tRNase [Corynebacterium afermentans]